MAKSLKDNLYREVKDRVTTVDSVTGRNGDEIEDLFPPDIVARIISKQLSRTLEDFDDVVDVTLPLVPQVKKFAEKHDFTLEEEWKVGLAKAVKDRVLQGRDRLEQHTLEIWQKLFTTLGAE